MTANVVVAVRIYFENNKLEQHPDEPALDAPEPGNPISHGQLVDISKYLKENPEKARSRSPDEKDIPIYLNELMRGCAIYVPPPKPKEEKVKVEMYTLCAKATNSVTDLRI